MRRSWRITAGRAGGEQRTPGTTGTAEVSVRKVAPLPVQSVTAAQVLLPDPAAPASLWQWLARLPDPRRPPGVRVPPPRRDWTRLGPPRGRLAPFTAAGGAA